MIILFLGCGAECEKNPGLYSEDARCSYLSYMAPVDLLIKISLGKEIAVDVGNRMSQEFPGAIRYAIALRLATKEPSKAEKILKGIGDPQARQEIQTLYYGIFTGSPQKLKWKQLSKEKDQLYDRISRITRVNEISNPLGGAESAEVTLRRSMRRGGLFNRFKWHKLREQKRAAAKKARLSTSLALDFSQKLRSLDSKIQTDSSIYSESIDFYLFAD